MSFVRPRGVIAATPTPVHADFTPDTERLAHHCRALLSGGCDAINLLGTTGEATSFSVAQRLTVMRAMQAAGLPIERFLVGTGLCSLEDTAALTQTASDMGFVGALVVPPFYYRDLPADGLIAYIETLLSKVARPDCRIYLYHIPQNTGVPWPIEIVTTLHQRFPNTIVGLKDSAGDLAYSRALAKALPNFDVFPSSEAALATAMQDGFAGVISGTTNVTAAESQIGWSNPGTTEAAEAITKAGQRRAALVRGSLLANVKATLADRYDDREWTRMCPPLQGLTPAAADTLRTALSEA